MPIVLIIYFGVANHPKMQWLNWFRSLKFEQSLVGANLCSTCGQLSGEWLESSESSLTRISDWQLMLAGTSAGTLVGTWPLYVAAGMPHSRVAGSQQ